MRPGDPYSAPLPPQPFLEAIRQPPAPQRILVATDSPFPGPATDRAVVAAVEATGRALERLGHEIDIGAAAFDADAVADAIAVLHNVSNVQLYDLARAHLGREPREDEFEASTWVMIREGWNTSGVAYADAIDALHAQTRRFAAGMTGTMCCWCRRCWRPAAVRCAGPARGSTRAFFDVEFAHTGWTPMANVTGWAAISLPLGSTADGLPIGVQLMAPEETILLQLAAALEQALPWAGGAPPDGSAKASDRRTAACETVPMVVPIARPKLEGNIAVGEGRQLGFAEFGDPQGGPCSGCTAPRAPVARSRWKPGCSPSSRASG